MHHRILRQLTTQRRCGLPRDAVRFAPLLPFPRDPRETPSSEEPSTFEPVEDPTPPSAIPQTLCTVYRPCQFGSEKGNEDLTAKLER